MKRRKFAIVLIPVIVVTLCLFATSPGAGLIHHKVKVTNNTDYTATVVLETFDGHQHKGSVSPHSDYTFDTGVKCPNYLFGRMELPDGKFKSITPCCTENSHSALGPGDCKLSCKSSHHKIEAMRVYDGSYVYHFQPG